MATKVKKRDRYNAFLDSNITLNSASELKEMIKTYKKGHIPTLLGALIIGSVSSLLLSFMASVLGYGNPTNYFFITLLVNFISVVINNIVFTVFLKRTREEKLTSLDISFFMKKGIPQLICLIVLFVAQTLCSILMLQITAIVPMLNVVMSILVSVVFTLLNAMVAFRIYDQKVRVRDILPGACNVLMKNWKSLLFICVLFITWSYVSNVAFSSMLYSQLQEVQGINNIFHGLLQQHDYLNLMKVGGFYGLNYIVAGFLEIDLLLGLAILYQRDRKACYHEK